MVLTVRILEVIHRQISTLIQILLTSTRVGISNQRDTRSQMDDGDKNEDAMTATGIENDWIAMINT